VSAESLSDATAPTAPEPPTTEEVIAAAAARHGVNPQTLLAVARCESNLDPLAVGDLALGTSRGLFQIHRPSHPTIPDSLAFDPAWSADWAAAQFAAGNAGWWSCWRILGRPPVYA
jgi:soluble lytic murein transglycosylase-like protein